MNHRLNRLGTGQRYITAVCGALKSGKHYASLGKINDDLILSGNVDQMRDFENSVNRRFKIRK